MSINLPGSSALVNNRGQRDLWPIPTRGRSSVCEEATSQPSRNSVNRLARMRPQFARKSGGGLVFR